MVADDDAVRGADTGDWPPERVRLLIGLRDGPGGDRQQRRQGHGVGGDYRPSMQLEAFSNARFVLDTGHLGPGVSAYGTFALTSTQQRQHCPSVCALQIESERSVER